MTSYILGKTHQSIDLNKGLENFSLTFNVNRTTPAGGEFYGAITERGTHPDQIEFQPSQNGVLNGEMNWQQNVLKDFILVLYADDATNVTVNVNVQPLPKLEENQQMVGKPNKDNNQDRTSG